MLNRKQAERLFMPLVVLVMSGLISFVMSAFNGTPGHGVILGWLRNWALGFAVALPASWVVVPRIQRLLAALTRRPDCEVHP
jgi:hypothetical protein